MRFPASASLPPRPVLRFPASVSAGDPRPALAGAVPALIQASRESLARDPADPEGMHRLRVALRRMRSLWRLAAPLHPGDAPRRSRQALARVARRLAPARDRDVIEGLLRDLLEIGEPVRHHRPVSPAVTHQAGAVLEASLREFLAFAPIGKGLGPWKDSLCRAYRRARSRLPDSPGDGDDAFHAWRKAVKDLRYGLDAWPSPRRKRLRRLLAMLDALQTGLGNAHDLSLAEAALAAAKHPGPAGEAGDGWPPGRKDRKRALRRAVAAKRSWKRKCLRYGGKLFAAPPGKFRKRYM